MHELHRHISKRLEKKLREHHVVVFYDPKRDFEPYIDELVPLEPLEGRAGLPRYWIEHRQTHVVRYDGSFFALRKTVEPLAEMDKPEPLLIYLPGVQRDAKGSVLMELEKGGTCYRPNSLRFVARDVLRSRHTEGEIDDMLPEDLTYGDAVRIIDQSAGASSILKLILGEAPSEVLIARWLAAAERDAELQEKQATEELFKLVTKRLGFALASGTPLPKARHQVLRFLLINEFRADLRVDPPAVLEPVPTMGNKKKQARGSEVLALLKEDHAAQYVDAADAVEKELRLPDLALDPAAFGAVDTFRFEEGVLLRHAANEVTARNYDSALALVAARGASFWVDRHLDAARWAQWELCRWAAELGREVERIRREVGKAGEDPKSWIDAYTRPGGWSAADRAQRGLESWMARMEEEAEESLEEAVGVVRREYEQLLEQMAQGYSRALEAASWAVPGILHQTRIFPEVVEAASGRTAYFLVDALRFEMGQELAELLPDAQDLRLVPAVSVLPSITPLGMAALLPEAAASFSVVESHGKLAARIDQSEMADLTHRRRFLVARRPASLDVDLGELLQKPTRSLAKKLADLELLVVRSQSIDGLGEMDSGHLARQIMDTIVGNVARAVRKLAKIGFERFVVAADHGHQFSLRKGEDMLLDKPGGETVNLHRRCWAGHGGKTSPAAVRVSGEQLGYDTDLDFIFPRGLAIFKTGGDLAYHHGGISLQEMIVPVLSLRIPQIEEGQPAPVEISGYPETITNRTFGVQLVVRKELFSSELVRVRLVLIAEGQEVGRTGMAVGATLDRTTGTVEVPPGKPISLGLLLDRADIQTLRIVAQEPTTDAILAQTDELPLKLGI